MSTKDLFKSFESWLKELSVVDSVWWSGGAPHTTQNNPDIGRYVMITPDRTGYSADNRFHYGQWQFLCHYISDDIDDHMTFIDEVDSRANSSVQEFYVQHRVVGWKPYTIVRINSFGDFSDTDDFNPAGAITPV